MNTNLLRRSNHKRRSWVGLYSHWYNYSTLVLMLCLVILCTALQYEGVCYIIRIACDCVVNMSRGSWIQVVIHRKISAVWIFSFHFDPWLNTRNFQNLIMLILEALVLKLTQYFSSRPHLKELVSKAKICTRSYSCWIERLYKKLIVYGFLVLVFYFIQKWQRKLETE